MKLKKKINNELLVISTLYIASILTFAAGSLGSYAWYSYNARAGVSYDGVAIGASDSFQIGIVSNDVITEFENSSIVSRDEIESNKSVYWCDELTDELVSAYCQHYGYSRETLGPSTSGKFANGDELKLKASPRYLERYRDEDARTRNYVSLPLVFRGSSTTGNIVLSDFELECENNIDEAVRIAFVDEANHESFILNPSSENDGYNEVGGLLNLNKDGIFDHNGQVEFLYGQYTDEQYSYEDVPYDYDENTDKANSFVAKHQEGIIRSYCTPERAYYTGYKDIISNRALANADLDGYIFLTVVVYLEGWDHACVESEIGNSFNLTLEFAYNS